MLEQMNNSEFVVFDCETTGLDYRYGHQIIELAGQKIQSGKVIDTFHQLINPTVPVDEGAYSVHGLSNLYLSENGQPAQVVLPQFSDFVKNCVLVGHNILSFDVPFLNADLMRVGQTPVKNLIVDTLMMARKLLPSLPNHKLGTVAKHFGIDPTGAHRALKDVDMNRQVFLNMLEAYLKTLKIEPSSEQVQTVKKATLI